VGAAVDGYEEGGSYKSLFPSVKKMLIEKIPIIPQLTNLKIAHSNKNSYLYRLGLTERRMCPCE